jgi:hypothetical protein
MSAEADRVRQQPATRHQGALDHRCHLRIIGVRRTIAHQLLDHRAGQRRRMRIIVGRTLQRQRHWSEYGDGRRCFTPQRSQRALVDHGARCRERLSVRVGNNRNRQRERLEGQRAQPVVDQQSPLKIGDLFGNRPAPLRRRWRADLHGLIAHNPASAEGGQQAGDHLIDMGALKGCEMHQLEPMRVQQAPRRQVGSRIRATGAHIAVGRKCRDDLGDDRRIVWRHAIDNHQRLASVERLKHHSCVRRKIVCVQLRFDQRPGIGARIDLRRHLDHDGQRNRQRPIDERGCGAFRFSRDGRSARQRQATHRRALPAAGAPFERQTRARDAREIGKRLRGTCTVAHRNNPPLDIDFCQREMTNAKCCETGNRGRTKQLARNGSMVLQRGAVIQANRTDRPLAPFGTDAHRFGILYRFFYSPS